MRRNARVDSNQKYIVERLRQVGASVAHTHMNGKGFPDIIVGFKGVNYLFEIKDGNKPPSAQKLTPDEVEFHAKWRGSIHVVNCFESACEILGIKI